MAFIIWSIVGVIIIILGIIDFFSKKPAGFWANVKTIEVKDVNGYNRATGILFILYGVLFIIFGLPLLAGQNPALVILSAFGVVAETIGGMAVYTLCIEKKCKA